MAPDLLDGRWWLFSKKHHVFCKCAPCADGDSGRVGTRKKYVCTYFEIGQTYFKIQGTYFFATQLRTSDTLLQGGVCADGHGFCWWSISGFAAYAGKTKRRIQDIYPILHISGIVHSGLRLFEGCVYVCLYAFFDVVVLFLVELVAGDMLIKFDITVGYSFLETISGVISGTFCLLLFPGSRCPSAIRGRIPLTAGVAARLPRTSLHILRSRSILRSRVCVFRPSE